MRLRRKSEPCAHCLGLDYKLTKLRPADGDVLVLRIPRGHTRFQCEQLVAQVQQLAPTVTCVAVVGDIEPAVARRLNLEDLA